MKTASSRVASAAKIFPAQRSSILLTALWMLAVASSLSGASTRPTTVPVIPPAVAHDLLAHGTDDRLWVATVVPKVDPGATGDRTVLRTRAAGDDQPWNTLAELPIGVSAIASRASELIAVLSNGEWRFITGAGSGVLIRSGPPLPAGAELVAIAGNEQALWAVGYGQAPPRPATTNAPATATAPTTLAVEAAPRRPRVTAPATPPPPQLRLYQLIAGEWRAAATLPAEIRPQTMRPFAFAVIGGSPLVAAPTGDGAIHVFQWSTSSTGDGEWLDRRLPPVSIPAHEIGLLDSRRRPMLWAKSRTGIRHLFTLENDGEWSGPVELPIRSPATQPTERALATAFGQTWLITMDPTGRLTQQEIDAAGRLAGEPAEIVTSSPGDMSRIGQIINLVVMLLLTWVMVVALRRRGKLQRAMLRAEQLHLAPLGLRFGAGAIDAIPLIVLTLIGFSQVKVEYETFDQLLMDPTVELWGIIALASYLLYTTLTEMTIGRTPGKRLFGLRVADLDGAQPSARAMLGRNLLRIVDVMLVFPVVMILFSPLRQRVGDLAAGTIVIAGEHLERPPDAVPDDEEEDAQE